MRYLLPFVKLGKNIKQIPRYWWRFGENGTLVFYWCKNTCWTLSDGQLANMQPKPQSVHCLYASKKITKLDKVSTITLKRKWPIAYMFNTWELIQSHRISSYNGIWLAIKNIIGGKYLLTWNTMNVNTVNRRQASYKMARSYRVKNRNATPTSLYVWMENITKSGKALQ